MIKVFHLNRDLDRDARLAITDPLVTNWRDLDEDALEAALAEMQRTAIRAALAAGHYTLVATVAANCMHYAYSKTNSRDIGWFEEPAIGVTPEPGIHRSTSIGDVVVNSAEEIAFVTRGGFQYLDPIDGQTEVPEAA
jgi:hypothetical protein